MSRRRNAIASRLSKLTFGLLLTISGPVAARAQDPLVTLPNNYRSILDNAEVAVIRAHYGAHENIPVHDHSSLATVFIYLNDSGPVRINHQGDGAASVTRPPTVKGAFRVSAGMAERHSIENLSDTSSEFLRVELKQASLRSLKEPFRGKAPHDLAQSQNSIEFTNPELQIERIVCAGPSACPISPSPMGSLLVAFTPLHLTSGATEAPETLDDGSVRWLPSSQAATITPGSGSPAHILRILLASRK